MKTNAHEWYGYQDGEYVPALPLSVKREKFLIIQPYTVRDAQGFVIASFRNWSDYDRFRTDMEKRFRESDRARK